MGRPTMRTDQNGSGLASGVREALEALVMDHAWLIDQGRADEIPRLYTEDGSLHGVGPDLVGRDAIAAWSVNRAAMRDRVSRHVCTNFRLVPVSDDEVHGTSILTVFRHDGAGQRGTTPFMVADCDAVYRRGDDGTWRIARRRLTPAFGGA